jgi:hypothetical protein
MAMLVAFIIRQEIDIIFLQEITIPKITTPPGYIAFTNPGTEGRGTAFIIR